MKKKYDVNINFVFLFKVNFMLNKKNYRDYSLDANKIGYKRCSHLLWYLAGHTYELYIMISLLFERLL